MTNVFAAAGSSRENLDLPPERDIRVSVLSFRRHRLELIMNGEAVSQADIATFSQHIGAKTLRMGGIAAVATPPMHRLKGYSRKVMQNALRWMRTNGFDTSMLYGITNFYPKFGFAEAFPNISLSLAVRDAERATSPAYNAVDYKPEHAQAILGIYHQNNRTRTGITERDPKRWQAPATSIPGDPNPPPACKTLLDKKGRMAGYFMYVLRCGRPTVFELGYASTAVFPAVLEAITRITWEKRCEQIAMTLPEDHPFVGFCKPLGLAMEIRCRKDGEAMIRMINIPAALEKIGGELAGRMAGAGKLSIGTNLDSVEIKWRKNSFDHRKLPSPKNTDVYMPQWAFAQLLYGYCAPAPLQAMGILRASEKSLAILAEMFPQRPHFHYFTDRF